MLVYAMRARDEAVLNALMPQRAVTGEQNEPVSRGLHLTVQCFEEPPLNTVELRERTRREYPLVLLDSGDFSDPSVCERLHPFRETPEHARPVDSEIPTLIVTSEFDPQTHRSNGPIVQRSLKNSQLADVPGAAHSGAFDHDCTRTIPPLKFVTDVKAIPR